MSNKHVIVDKVTSLDLPNRSLAAAQGVGVPGHVVVHLSGSAALLDLSDAKAVVWEAVLQDVRQANEPVFLETDPNTNVIKQLLLPKSMIVADIAPAPVGNRHEVDLEISHARHYLNTTHPDYQQFLNALSVARKQGIPVLVTETLDDHEIIDVRPDPSPFVGGPALMVIPPAGPFGNLGAAAAGVTPQKSQQLFNLVANQSYIPYQYPDDGCWGRAHEMCRLILANGESPRKVWIYGNLMVSNRNHPKCSVRWGWHVAPTVLVDTGSNSQIDVIDPALFTAPVPQATWVGVQNDPHASIHDTDASVFYRRVTGQVTYDPNYTQTQQVLAQYRRELALRSAQFGPPPYKNCP